MDRLMVIPHYWARWVEVSPGTWTVEWYLGWYELAPNSAATTLV